MAEIKRFCKNFHTIPHDWNRRYCPFCGERIKSRIIKKRPAPKRARPEGDESESGGEEPKGQKIRKLISRSSFKTFPRRERTVLGPRFMSASPALLFIVNALTGGLRYILWIAYHMPSLVMMARNEEKEIEGARRLWLFSYLASAALVIISAVIFVISGFNFEKLKNSFVPYCAIALNLVSFLACRQILFWAREVIIDELASSKNDVVKSRAGTFAPSPIMLWFIGIPYIQLHINRMIKKKRLASNAYSRKGSGARRTRRSQKTRSPESNPESPRTVP
jgi:hypothetical protein